jgi:hypothetical protein
MPRVAFARRLGRGRERGASAGELRCWLCCWTDGADALDSGAPIVDAVGEDAVGEDAVGELDGGGERASGSGTAEPWEARAWTAGAGEGARSGVSAPRAEGTTLGARCAAREKSNIPPSSRVATTTPVALHRMRAPRVLLGAAAGRMWTLPVRLSSPLLCEALRCGSAVVRGSLSSLPAAASEKTFSRMCECNVCSPAERGTAAAAAGLGAASPSGRVALMSSARRAASPAEKAEGTMLLSCVSAKKLPL